MAAAANWFGNKLSGNPQGNNNNLQNNTALVRSARQGHYALRSLPNEDIALWVKSIDNTRVARPSDPQVHSDLWRYIGGAVAAVAIVVGLLLPGAYGWLAGYQLSGLEKERKALMEQHELLKLQQAQVEGPKQLEQWAAEHGMKAPDSKRMVYLHPAGDKSVAKVETAPSDNR